MYILLKRNNINVIDEIVNTLTNCDLSDLYMILYL